jgi:hypothetical protein
MRFPRQLPTLAVLTVGAMFGYFAASGEPRTVARADSARNVSNILAEKTTNAPSVQLPCCDAKLDRTSALTDTVQLADANAVVAAHNLAVATAAQATGKKPNILCIWGDDIGMWNISHNNRGMMGYKTPNIDRIAREGVGFTDYYAQQSCTAGRAAFISGSVPVRSGMTKVGMPGAKEGWQKTDVTMATILKRTTRGTATNTCRRCTALTNSLAASTTSTPKKNRNSAITREIWNCPTGRPSCSSSARAAC